MNELLDKYSHRIYDEDLIADLNYYENEDDIKQTKDFLNRVISLGIKKGDLWTGENIHDDTLYSIQDLLNNNCFDVAIKMIKRLKEVDDNGWLDVGVVWYALDNINDTPLTVYDFVSYGDDLPSLLNI